MTGVGRDPPTQKNATQSVASLRSRAERGNEGISVSTQLRAPPQMRRFLSLAFVASALLAGGAPAQDIRINPGRDDDIRSRILRTSPQTIAAFRPSVAKVAQS